MKRKMSTRSVDDPTLFVGISNSLREYPYVCVNDAVLARVRVLSSSAVTSSTSLIQTLKNVSKTLERMDFKPISKPSVLPSLHVDFPANVTFRPDPSFLARMLRGTPVSKCVRTHIFVKWYGASTELILYAEDSGVIDPSTKIHIHTMRHPRSVNQQKYYETALLKQILTRIHSNSSSTFILVTGPSGSGKTALLDAVMRKSSHPIKRFYPNRVAHSLEGDSELYLSKMLSITESPSILLIDDVDVLAADREDSASTSLSRSLCGQFVRTLSRLLTKTSSLYVVVTAIDASKLDREFLALFRVKLQIPSLDLEHRSRVLRVLTRDMPLSERISLARIAGVTSGFRPADLLNLCREAAFRSVRRDAEEIEWLDFKDALRVVRSNLLSIATGQEEAEEKHNNDDEPKIDLPGLRSQKELLETCILYPLLLLSSSRGVKREKLPMHPPKGIIVYVYLHSSSRSSDSTLTHSNNNQQTQIRSHRDGQDTTV